MPIDDARPAPVPSAPHQPGRLPRLLQGLALLLAGLLLSLYYLHLSADFPANSPWMDWAKYTDEGWYGDAAIRHYDLGHWYVPGDFNPAVALPVWPLLLAALFHFTGPGIVAARALSVTVFACILVGSFRLLRRATLSVPHATPAYPFAPAAAVLLLAANPFCFAFMRMAVLEPLLVLLTLLALLTASSLRPFGPRRAHTLAPALLLGLLLPLIALTKTTGIFLFPAIAWLAFARCGYRLRTFLQPALVAAAIGLALWGSYFALVVHHHLLSDYRYLFSANAYSGLTPYTAVDVVTAAIKCGQWTGPVLYPLALAALLATPLLRPLRREPIAVSLVLWILGYGAFLIYHDNLQPRYYTVVAVPLTLLLALVLERTWTSLRSLPAKAVVVAAIALLTVSTAVDARHTLRYALHPQYNFVSAARQIGSIINADPTHPRLLLSISGSDISLMSGVPSICDDYGTMDLDVRIAHYKPGWYATWNAIDDDKMDALTPLFNLERVAAFPAYDDPVRNLLILYRLVPRAQRGPRTRHPGKPLPRQLQTRSGQQPSAAQLIH